MEAIDTALKVLGLISPLLVAIGTLVGLQSRKQVDRADTEQKEAETVHTYIESAMMLIAPLKEQMDSMVQEIERNRVHSLKQDQQITVLTIDVQKWKEQAQHLKMGVRILSNQVIQLGAVPDFELVEDDTHA